MKKAHKVNPAKMEKTAIKGRVALMVAKEQKASKAHKAQWELTVTKVRVVRLALCVLRLPVPLALLALR